MSSKERDWPGVNKLRKLELKDLDLAMLAALMTGKEYYACPTCKRAVATGTEKCQGCGQKLSWDNIRHENEAKGSKKAKIEFDVPADFALEDCRKCPLSYIGRNGDENVYECPLQMRGSCRLELS